MGNWQHSNCCTSGGGSGSDVIVVVEHDDAKPGGKEKVEAKPILMESSPAQTTREPERLEPQPVLEQAPELEEKPPAPRPAPPRITLEFDDAGTTITVELSES